MRVALLHPSYWPEVRRGSERLVHDVAAGLADRGHEVTLITSHPARRSVTVEDGFTVVRAWRPPPSLLRLSAEHHLAHAPAVARAVLGGRFDVVHAFYGVDAWASIKARRLGAPPVVFSLNGIPTRQGLVARRYRMPILLSAAAEAAARTVLSRAAAVPFRRYLLHEPEIVPGGVSISDFAVDRPRAARPTLLCAASLNDPRKRGRLLLRAFSRLRERHPEARLLLAGRPDPMEAGGPLELPDGAEWIDGDRTEELAGAYASAWASVLPSIEEAFGLTLVESLAAGTPVVAARSGGCPEIVTDDAIGRLFEPDDEEGLARAMEEAMELARHPRTGERCRQRARSYDWPSILPRYESLYEQALAEAAPRPRTRRSRSGG